MELCGRLVCIFLLATALSNVRADIKYAEKKQSEDNLAPETECEIGAHADNLSPVCGSDSKTYMNQKLFECAKRGSPSLVIVYRGRCEDACWQAVAHDTLTTGKPVCGSDGTVYPSQAVLDCTAQRARRADLTARPMTYCEDTDIPFDPCSLAVSPIRKVCGSDNVTYSNIWDMVCTAKLYHVDITTQHTGQCNIVCPYSPIYKPVCSVSQNTFANIEALQCRQILSPYIKNDFKHSRECAHHAPKNPCYAESTFVPVCASNGRTYSKAQHVHCLKATNPELRVLHNGPCTVAEVKKIIGEQAACDLAPDRYEWNPVCGSDNVTYSNPYHYLCVTLNQTGLSVVDQNECGAFNYCTQENTAHTQGAKRGSVCANDGTTYSSIEQLYCAQKSKRHLRLLHNDACTEGDDPCLYRSPTRFLDNSGVPVCASNGVTYVTPEAAWCAMKAKADIEFIHDGACFD